MIESEATVIPLFSRGRVFEESARQRLFDFAQQPYGECAQHLVQSDRLRRRIPGHRIPDAIGLQADRSPCEAILPVSSGKRGAIAITSPPRMKLMTDADFSPRA